MASNVRHFTLSGRSLKCAEEKTETNKMFSAASRQAYLDAMLLISFILRRTQGCQLWLPEFSCKAGVKISFGVISEVDLWEDVEKKRKKNTGGKMKSCRSNAFVLCSQMRAHAGQKPQRTWSHFWSLGGKKCFAVNTAKAVCVFAAFTGLLCDSLDPRSLCFFASNYFPIRFQILTTCQHYTEAQMRESLGEKMPRTSLPKHINVWTKGTHVKQRKRM